MEVEATFGDVGAVDDVVHDGSVVPFGGKGFFSSCENALAHGLFVAQMGMLVFCFYLVHVLTPL